MRPGSYHVKMAQMPDQTPISLFSAVLLLAGGVAAQEAPRAISFDDLMGRKVRYAVPAPQAKWTEDGKLLRVREAGPSKQKIVAKTRNPRSWEVVEAASKPGPSTEEMKKDRVSIDSRTG